MNPSPTFHLRLFGSPSIERGDGVPLTGRVAQRHRLALLALLAMAPGHRMSRDKLITYLWPENDVEGGRNLLKVSSYVLRTGLGDAILLSEGDDLRLHADLIRTDTGEFEAALARGDHARAAALYRSPFLDGFFLSDAPEFEQWAGRERERLAADYGRSLEALGSAAEAEGNAPRAAEWWKMRAAQDPYDSRVAVRLMQALDASGNRAGALQLAAVHQRLLEEEFGIAAAPEVSALAERLRTASERMQAGTVAPREDPRQAVPGNSRQAVVPPTADATHHDGPRQAGLTGAPPPAHPSPELAAVPDAPREQGANRSPARTLVVGLVALVLVTAAIWALWPGGAPRERSIAVLPFVNLSPEGDNEYFSDGLTEEILTGLAGVPGLKVISRTSAMTYKGTDKPLRQIAEELDVAHILEGSVRQNEGRVRISAQLIDARTDEHLWARNYDSELRDIFRVQEEIARHVVRALEIELGERGKTSLVTQRTSDPEADEFYRRARYLWNTRTREGHERAIEYFGRAIARDSGFADAYAGLADAYSTSWQLNLSSLPASEIQSRARWAAERALALDDRSADAHTSFAASLQWQGHWPGAERELRRAIELNPSHATARSWYSLLLAGMGRTREAMEQSRRATELDPFAVVTSSNYGWQCYLTRNYDCAIEQHRRTLEIRSNYPGAFARLGLAYAKKGMLDEAVQAATRAVGLAAERPDFLADLAYALALRGDTAAALDTLQRAKAQPFEAFNIARAYVALGQADSAFAWLERSSWQWPHKAVLSDPALDPVRSDPRFARLQARVEQQMGLRQADDEEAGHDAP